MHDRSMGARGIISFIVDMHRDGVRSGKPEDKLGIRGSGTSSLMFEDYRAKDSERLGEVGGGFKVAMSTLDGGRIGIASQAIGIARAALESSMQYAAERKQFGQPIKDFQAIQFKIADMATRITAARTLLHAAAAAKERGETITRFSSMAKLFASETAMWVTTQAIQILGGYGYVTDYPVERFFRDAKVTEIYEGTSEIQRIVIARETLAAAVAADGSLPD
jgi:alkylation response protein AidB-like acyl-CoA dehydrogenase